MKKRIFALMIVLGFVVSFGVSKNPPAPENYSEQGLVSIDTSAVKAAPIEYLGPLEDMRIVLDAGHGGFDGGAVGQNGTLEKDIALSTVLLLRDMLEEEGAFVQLTRENDVFLSLKSRVHVAGTNRAHLFISIHADGFENPDAKGMTTYYYDHQSEPLAASIHEYIFKEEVGTENRGIDFGNYQVLRDSFMPAVLLEIGYITNEEDEMLLNSPEFQEKISKQIIQGIVHHVNARNIMDKAHIDIAEDHSSNEIIHR